MSVRCVRVFCSCVCVSSAVSECVVCLQLCMCVFGYVRECVCSVSVCLKLCLCILSYPVTAARQLLPVGTAVRVSDVPLVSAAV